MTNLNSKYVVDLGCGRNLYVKMLRERLPGVRADGVADLLELLAAWGPNPGHPADLTGDGNVGVADLLVLLSSWGPCR